MVVHSIDSIKELKNEWIVHASFELVWTDQRLKMQNLKTNNKRNLLSDMERSQIWIPEVIFSNNKFQNRLILDEKAEVSVIRTQNNSYVPGYQDLESGLIFDGLLNKLKYSRTFTEQFTCNFDLRFYPFDIQKCHINLTVPGAVTDLVQLIPENIDYVGPLLLNQFEIINTSANSWPNIAQFTIMFRRLYDYQIISVHIPSVFLLFISLLTNYVNILHYEANIMVHITIMLVMYTLFQAISVSLPQVKRDKL